MATRPTSRTVVVGPCLGLGPPFPPPLGGGSFYGLLRTNVSIYVSLWASVILWVAPATCGDIHGPGPRLASHILLPGPLQDSGGTEAKHKTGSLPTYLVVVVVVVVHQGGPWTCVPPPPLQTGFRLSALLATTPRHCRSRQFLVAHAGHRPLHTLQGRHPLKVPSRHQ